jgi:3-deoxy-D-manno-octulosonic-acid transferase
MMQRFGFFRSRYPGQVLWIHAVSAGETVAAAPLIRRLTALGYPCLVTNMTPTGRDRVDVLLGDSVENCYAPYDLPGSLNRFLSVNRPGILITIDTELWPNMLAQCHKRGVKTMVVNGRMSARSAAGYQRIERLIRPMLESIDRFAVQTEQHRDRFIALGADKNRVTVTGSIKFDGEFSAGHEQRSNRAQALTARRMVLLGASTHEGEEDALLSLLPALKGVVPEAFLILAPRHTHRCDHVAKLCAAAGFQAMSFSELKGNELDPSVSVLILDRMGELESFFPVAQLAFIGGSLVPVGGHNLLEAVRAGTGVVMGKHLDNIEDIAQQFVDHDAMCVVSDAGELKDEVIGLMRDEGRIRRLVTAADEVLAANRGSLARVEEIFLTVMQDG